jgi:uncharacterized protein
VRILVTGASGLIGSAVCGALLARGDHVVGLSRDAARARAKNSDVEWHDWIATTEPPAAAALAGVEGVVNLLGESVDQKWTEEAKRRMWESRVTATRNLVTGIAAMDPRPRVLVSGSMASYYGDGGDALLDESAPAGTRFDSEVCVAWEVEARGAEALGVRVVVVRIGLVLDKRGGVLPPLLLPFRLGLGGPFAGGRQYLPWIHVDDEVGIMLWALDDERVSGPLNGTAPSPVTNREFAKALGRVLGRPTLMPIPKLAVRLLRGAELADAAAGGPRAVPRRALELGYEFRHPELDGALRAALQDRA